MLLELVLIYYHFAYVVLSFQLYKYIYMAILE